MSNRFQPFTFQSTEEFFDYISRDELKIVNLLRSLIFQCIPECVEKLSYNVPYYSRNRRICFIWPASIPWGTVNLQGVQFGFCYGSYLRDESNYLERKGRKQVFCKTFFTSEEINPDILRSFLFEALEIDNSFKRKK